MDLMGTEHEHLVRDIEYMIQTVTRIGGGALIAILLH